MYLPVLDRYVACRQTAGDNNLGTAVANAGRCVGQEFGGNLAGSQLHETI